MLLASTLAGMSFTWGGLGGVHALAADGGLTHGRSNAALLPHVMRFNLEAAAGGYARVAGAMGEEVRGSFSRPGRPQGGGGGKRPPDDLGVCYRLRDYGVLPPRALEMAAKSYRYAGRLLPNNPRELTAGDAAASTGRPGSYAVCLWSVSRFSSNLESRSCRRTRCWSERACWCSLYFGWVFTGMLSDPAGLI